MKKIIILFSAILPCFLFAQRSGLSENNLIFGFEPSLNFTGVKGDLKNTRGGKFIGFQTYLGYHHRYNEHFSGEFGLGYGLVQNGFVFDMLKADLPLLDTDYLNIPYSQSFSCIIVPTRFFYYKPITTKRTLYGSAGVTISKFIDEETRSGFGFNNIGTGMQTTFFSPKGNFINLTFGIGLEKQIKRGNIWRYGIEYQLGGNKSTNDFEMIQANGQFAKSSFYTRQSMLRANFVYLFSNKKELKIETTQKEYNTAKRDFYVAYELGLSGTIINPNAPNNAIVSQKNLSQTTHRLALAFLYSRNLSIEANVRLSDFFEVFSYKNGFGFGSGSIGPISFGLGHHYYRPLGKKWYLNAGTGASIYLENEGYLGSTGSSNGFSYNTYSKGKYLTADASLGMEFSLTKALRLSANFQYAQGLTKAYRYQFTDPSISPSSFIGYSRGSNYGVTFGTKVNFGYLYRKE